MQSINIVVINPLFLGLFLGTAALCAVLIVAALAQWDAHSAVVLTGAALYLVGTFLVTIAFNVPLNNQLAAVVTPSAPDAAQEWTRYVTRWTRWNHLRTLAALAAAASFIAALRL
jgi:uncharacterized membrane protein